MNDVVWEDPPPRARGPHKGRVKEFLSELAQHPGKWALWASDSSTPSHPFNYAASRLALQVEVAARKQPDGTYRIYARVVEL